LKKRKRMTANKAGALGDDAKKWNSINWKKARREIRRLLVSVDSGYAPRRKCPWGISQRLYRKTDGIR